MPSRGQSVAPDIFEVIVVDDGSTDDTEKFCRNFRAAFPFQYLRQLNASAGVRHARGEFLVLLNDDTISAPDLLAEHRKAHRVCANDRQAVLGDFRFPPAAQDHALTRFLIAARSFFRKQLCSPALIGSTRTWSLAT